MIILLKEIAVDVLDANTSLQRKVVVIRCYISCTKAARKLSCVLWIKQGGIYSKNTTPIAKNFHRPMRH